MNADGVGAAEGQLHPVEALVEHGGLVAHPEALRALSEELVQVQAAVGAQRRLVRQRNREYEEEQRT